MLTRNALITVIGSEGMENPAHDPRISMPYGRGRRSPLAIAEATPTTTSPTPTVTNRSRHRRRTTRTGGLACQMTKTPAAVARTPATRAARVSQGVRRSAIACSTRVSATSTTRTLFVTRTTTQATTTRTDRPSHHLPDALRCRGRGGGSPEGRRRLRTRSISGGAGRGTGTARTWWGVPAVAAPCRTMFHPEGHQGQPLWSRSGATVSTPARLPGGDARAASTRRIGARSRPGNGAATGPVRLQPGSPPIGGAADHDPVRVLRLPGEPDPGRGVRRGGPSPGTAGVDPVRDRHPGGGGAGAPAGRGGRGGRLPGDGPSVRPADGHRSAPGSRADVHGPPAHPGRSGCRRPTPRRRRPGPERVRRDGLVRHRTRGEVAVRPGPARPPAVVRR